MDLLGGRSVLGVGGLGAARVLWSATDEGRFPRIYRWVGAVLEGGVRRIWALLGVLVVRVSSEDR